MLIYNMPPVLLAGGVPWVLLDGNIHEATGLPGVGLASINLGNTRTSLAAGDRPACHFTPNP